MNACRTAYINHLRAVASGRDQRQTKVRDRLDRLKADKLAIEVETLKRERLPSTEVRAFWLDAVHLDAVAIVGRIIAGQRMRW